MEPMCPSSCVTALTMGYCTARRGWALSVSSSRSILTENSNLFSVASETKRKGYKIYMHMNVGLPSQEVPLPAELSPAEA